MVAMVRRALIVDDQSKIRVSPLTESVQIRIYRTISKNPNAAKEEGNPGIQDVCEFMLNRSELFAGKHGLRPLGPQDRPVGFGPFRQHYTDPLVTMVHSMPALGSCTSCHQQPGIYSVESIARGFSSHAHNFGAKVYDFNVNASYMVKWKYRQFNWGLLQGLLEGQK